MSFLEFARTRHRTFTACAEEFDREVLRDPLFPDTSSWNDVQLYFTSQSRARARLRPYAQQLWRQYKSVLGKVQEAA